MEQEEEGKAFTLLCRSDTCKGRQGNREGCGGRASDFSAALRSLGQVYREPRGKVCQLWESHTGQRGPDALSKHWLGAYWGEHQHKSCVVIPKFWRHSSQRLSLSHPPHDRFFFIIIIFIFKLYNIVLVLPNIEINRPQAYMCSPS